MEIVGARDDFDVLPPPLHHRAHAEHDLVLVILRAGQCLDDLPALLGHGFDGLDQSGRVHRRSGERAERGEELLSRPSNA